MGYKMAKSEKIWRSLLAILLVIDFIVCFLLFVRHYRLLAIIVLFGTVILAMGISYQSDSELRNKRERQIKQLEEKLTNDLITICLNPGMNLYSVMILRDGLILVDKDYYYTEVDLDDITYDLNGMYLTIYVKTLNPHKIKVKLSLFKQSQIRQSGVITG